MHSHRPRQRRHGTFRGAIRQVVSTPSQRRNRRHVDDRAAGGLHQRNRFTTTEEHAVAVDAQYLVPVLQRCLLYRTLAQDASVVKEDVEATIPLADEHHDLLPVVFAAGIVTNEYSRCADFLRQRLTLNLVDIADHDLRTFGGQQACTRTTDTVRTAGNQGDLTLHSSCHKPLLVVLGCRLALRSHHLRDALRTHNRPATGH
ncbi:hypothetical protein D3C78_592330 [compost metagenome]